MTWKTPPFTPDYWNTDPSKMDTWKFKVSFGALIKFSRYSDLTNESFYATNQMNPEDIVDIFYTYVTPTSDGKEGNATDYVCLAIPPFIGKMFLKVIFQKIHYKYFPSRNIVIM